MSFLDGLFVRTINDALEISDDHLVATAAILPGYLYELEGSDTAVVLTVDATLAEAVGKRIAVKVHEAAPSPPGGALTVAVPGGQQIENDSGVLGASAVIDGDQVVGNYREWYCDPSGNWIMVVGAAGGGGGVPPASTYEDGGAEELDVTGLAGLLADPQNVSIARNGTDVAARTKLNLVEGLGIALTVADNTTPNPDRVDATIAEKSAAAAFAFAANAATLDVSANKNHAASNTLTGNSTITLTNGADGMNGLIFVKQDATGSRTLSFTIAGRTVLKDLNVTDTNPLASANGITMYQYFFVTIAGTACVVLNKVYLQ